MAKQKNLAAKDTEQPEEWWHPLGKKLHSWASPFILRTTAANRTRVRVRIRDKRGRVLLVKGWFSSQAWGLPGGGIERGESATQAAVREVYEETGLVIDESDLTYLGIVEADLPLTCYLLVYGVTIDPKDYEPSNHKSIEIISIKWYNKKDLPSTEVGSATLAAINGKFAE